MRERRRDRQKIRYWRRRYKALSEPALAFHSMAELGAFLKRSSAGKARELGKRVEYGAAPELLDLIQIRA